MVSDNLRRTHSPALWSLGDWRSKHQSEASFSVAWISILAASSVELFNEVGQQGVLAGRCLGLDSSRQILHKAVRESKRNESRTLLLPFMFYNLILGN
ncbi:hypothetical protein TorRG33x02_216980 [Trema orientale]|uniref:Uncharacterized protein n=1 Tax=Trema orientale TaxID=63057 RepID=A0A2P5EA77_TREOI|nr:hypothetical protein TorRG33x02_216980 [Trema orientale]